jgi:hypothetical protein
VNKRVLLAFICACGGASEVVAEPPQPVALPTVATVAPEAPPPMRHAVGPGEVTLTVSFVEVRRHPEASRVDTILRGSRAWRAFPTIDPINDLEWLVQHDDNDMVVEHSAPDARVDAAIDAVAQPVHVGAPGVKAWRGVVNGHDTVFLRAQPRIVRIAPADGLEAAARDLVAHAPVAPSFHANEALRARALHPSQTFTSLPDDISEARLWVDSRIADSSADIYVEADCPNAAAATADAAAITALIQRTNSFGVRIVTSGLFNTVDVTTVDRQVHLHIHATQQQIASVVNLAASMY